MLSDIHQHVEKTNPMPRRKFLGRFAAAVGGMMLSGCLGGKEKAPPNIVMLISDDQGWGDYGFMGHKAIETPALDKLASEGVLFTRGYVTAPLCCPSLATIITGLYPYQHKITGNDPPYDGKGSRWNPAEWSGERRRLREQMIAHIDEAPTLPRMLGKRGYASLQTGKWWLGHYKRGGFTHGMTHGDMDRGGRHGDVGLDIGRKTMQPIYDFLDDAANRPFFLWYAPFLPHRPHTPPERLLNKYKKKTDSIHLARYWASCEWFDETCGALLNYLEEKGLAENTMVLYVCDNGWIQRPDDSGYAPRSKRTPYEGGIRTPIIVKWPGRIKPHRDDETLASSIDLAPTVLQSVGLAPTADMQGINLLDTQALKRRNAVFGAAYTHDEVDVNDPLANLHYTWCIEGEWKLILPSGKNDTGTQAELYNLAKDPNETTNLAADMPEKVRHLKQRIHNWQPQAVAVEPDA